MSARCAQLAITVRICGRLAGPGQFRIVPFASLSSRCVAPTARTCAWRLGLPRNRLPCRTCGSVIAHYSLSCSGGSGPRPPRSGGSGGGGRGDGSWGAPRTVANAATSAPSSTGEHLDVILLDVGGMMCGGCVSRVRRLLQSHDRVTSASVNLATESALARVRTGDDARPDAHLMGLGAALVQILRDAGFEAAVRDADSGAAAAAAAARRKRSERQERLATVTRNLGLAWLLASTCLVGHLLHCWPGVATAPAVVRLLASTELHAALSVATLLGPGRSILTDGAAALARGRPDMNSLVGLGAVSAFGVSAAAALLPGLGWRAFFEEPAMLLGVVLLGRTLEERAKLQASADMVSLYSLLPSSARLVLGAGAGARLREVPVDAVAEGDLVRVLPGDRVPVDGVVVAGRTTVDESALTGEAMPVPKRDGDHVTAGTTNVDGACTVRSEAAAGDTAIADIVRAVEGAQARAAPIQRLADDIAGRFAYAVMGLSAATFAFWAGLGSRVFPAVASATFSGSPLLLSLQLACNVLVVACPCALGLATPTAVLVGTSAAAKHGLLVRGGDVLEALTRIDTVVFDKTGTLTTGAAAVVGAEGARGTAWSRAELLGVAAAVEAGSTHPIARAIVAAAGGGAERADEGTFVQEPGSGIAAAVNGQLVAVGTPEWLERQGCAGAASALEADVPATGVTRIWVAVDGALAGHVDLRDELRPGAVGAIAGLRRRGLRTILLSGDRESAVLEIARQLGLGAEDTFAGVKPEGKLRKIEELRAAGARVAMVGDGINDTAALAAADIGIAMAGGVQVAGDVADVVLLGDRPGQVVEAIALSNATMSKIRQNLVWAFGYNLVGIPVAAGALLPHFGIALSPSISGALMGVSSLAVMGNSLLLRRAAGRIVAELPGDEDGGADSKAPSGGGQVTVTAS